MDAMRQTVAQVLIGVMLFCSLESAVDASTVTSHHGTGPTHAAHHGPEPAPDHDDDDCQHVCHCAAHLPSIAIVDDPLGYVQPGVAAFTPPPARFTTRAVIPPLRPPIS